MWNSSGFSHKNKSEFRFSEMFFFFQWRINLVNFIDFCIKRCKIKKIKSKIRADFIPVHPAGATTQQLKYRWGCLLQLSVNTFHIMQTENGPSEHCILRLLFKYKLFSLPICFLGPHFQSSITGGLLWSYTLQILSSQLRTFPLHFCNEVHVSIKNGQPSLVLGTNFYF